MNPAAHTLLWFRPISPLNYVLPVAVAMQPWAGTQHIPIDTLQACELSLGDVAVLNASSVWLLSSPTAAHLAAQWGRPSVIAVMGTPTQSAWREAGGQEPAQWLVSPTGESMGLESALRQHNTVCVLRGRQGRNDLIEVLLVAGVSVNAVPVYEKSQHPQFANLLNQALSDKPTALYFSSTDQPARALAAAAKPAALLASSVFVSHARIATAAQAQGFQTVTLVNTES
jgi:uroporphyrinogen-III synthase